jgi:adenylate cyclase class IV
LEVKLLAVGVKGLQTMVDRVENALREIFKEPDILIGNAADLYWKAPKTSHGDFVRLRRNSNTENQGQITLKATDKGDNVDRVEIDLEIDDYKQAKVLMLALHGEPLATVTKKYHVFFLENRDTTISVYQIKDDDRVFVEVEARTTKRVRQLVEALNDNLTEYEWIQSSVYNMFVQQKAMIRKPIKAFLETA